MQKNILIIDDDEELCEELKEILETEGYAVDLSLDGKEVHTVLSTKRYDLILLDIKLPDITGEKLLLYIKDSMPDIPVFIVSGSPLTSKERSTRLHAVADKVIAKPFRISEVLDTIRCTMET